MRYVDNIFSLDRPGIGILLIYMSVEGLIFFILTLIIEVNITDLHFIVDDCYMYFILYYTNIKNHFYKMNRDIGMADYEKQVKQDFHTPSLYLCFVIGA